MAWDTLCAGTAAYFDVLFPGEGMKLFQVEPCPPGRQMGNPRAGGSRHRVPSQPVPEKEVPVQTSAESSDSIAWDSVRESMSTYFDVPSLLRVPAWDVLFPEDGFETGLRNLGSHSMPRYFVPAREVPKAAAGDMSPEKGCAAPPFLEAYLELAFPGEGLNLFQGRSAHQCANPQRSGKCSHIEWTGAASQKRPPVPEDRELRASLGKVYSSEVMPPAPEVPVDGDSKIAPGSLDSDSVSTVSGSEAVPALVPSSSNNSLDLWSSDSGLASSDATCNEEVAAVSPAHVEHGC